jgi:exopolysaccharide production protein ExoZ
MLGDASYSTYLFHIFVLVALSKVFPITPMLAVPYVVVALVISTLVGMLFFRMVERPTGVFLRNIRPDPR